MFGFLQRVILQPFVKASEQPKNVSQHSLSDYLDGFRLLCEIKKWFKVPEKKGGTLISPEKCFFL